MSTTTATLPAAGGDSAVPSAKNSKRSVKSVAKSTKAKSPRQHPTYKEMVSAAVAALKDRKGTSRQAVSKYIKTNYKVKENCDLHVNGALVKGVTSGTLIQTAGKGASGRFKLAKVEKKAVVKPRKVAAKKPAVKKAAKAVRPKKAAESKMPLPLSHQHMHQEPVI